MKLQRTAIATVLLLLAAGCGGEDEAEQGFTLAASRACLARLGDPTPVRGGIAEGASDAVRLRVPSSVVTVLFASDADAASTIAVEYGVARGQRDQIANVVLAWASVPRVDDAAAVEDCIA